MHKLLEMGHDWQTIVEASSYETDPESGGN